MNTDIDTMAEEELEAEFDALLQRLTPDDLDILAKLMAMLRAGKN